MRIFAQALNITYETAHGETSPGRLKFLIISNFVESGLTLFQVSDLLCKAPSPGLHT